MDNDNNDSDNNPLLRALPPETDYLSYLTILEYNLTAKQLPTLHGILQDQTLTANIGWDLVHLLLPLLPASQQCLQDVSRLGNPREVVLKVTELLESLGSEEDEEHEDEDQDEDDTQQEGGIKEAKKLEDISRQDIEIQDESGGHIHPALRDPPKPPTPPSKAVKFIALLEMLSILHPRIKTKYPSRFLSTSLQAILPAYMQVARLPEATEAVLSFIKDLSGTQRPKLPPRKSSTQILTSTTPQSAPDPEGSDEVLGTDETGLQSRLLQSFLTYVTEGHMTSLVADENVPGMAWSSRFQEKIHSEKIIPGRRTYTSLFADQERLHELDTITGNLLALSRDLKIKAPDLLTVIKTPEPSDEATDNEELPSTASNVPLSRTGSTYLLATMAASSTFFTAPASLPPLQLIPDFAAILGSSLGDSATGSTGAEPEALIDAVLFLGFLVLEIQSTTTTTTISPSEENDKIYNNILQRLSLLSANTPSPILRYNAHLLTSSILHAHPIPNFRLAFIRDTLEHCPYENLKAEAVGWLKGEILAVDKKAVSLDGAESENISIFALPAVLETLQPVLFPDPETAIEGLNEENAWSTFQAHQTFYLAVLNLMFLLLSSPSLSQNLDIKSQLARFEQFVKAMEAASRNFRSSVSADNVYVIDDGRDEEGKGAALAGLELLDVTLEQIGEVLRKRRGS